MVTGEARRGLLARAGRVLLAPAIWVERTRGWKRFALILAYLVIGAIGLVFAVRFTAVQGLPDIGDPFDVDAYVRGPQSKPFDRAPYYEQAAAEFKAYREVIGAVASLGPPPARRRTARRSGPAVAVVRWADADQETRNWLEANRKALELWRKGTEHPEVDYPSFDFEKPMRAPWPDFLQFAALAIMEGSRLEHDGSTTAAWEWYRAVLRCSRQLAARGDARTRHVSGRMVAAAADAIKTWASNPQVDAAQLRAALKELSGLEAAHPPVSNLYKTEYVNVMRALREAPLAHRRRRGSDDPWLEDLVSYQAARAFVRNESERTRRIIQLVFANWLAQADKPWPARAPLVTSMRLYDDPNAPPNARVLSPEELDRWAQATPLVETMIPSLPMIEGFLTNEPMDWATLVVALAEQLHFRDRGYIPARPEDLVGRYLEKLPAALDIESPLTRVGPRPGLPEIDPIYSTTEPGLDLLGPHHAK
jgi:hypothetical protein